MAYDYDPEDKFGYKDTLPESHPEKVITGVEFDEEFKKIEQAVQGLQDTLDGKLDVITAGLVMGGTYSLVSNIVVRSLKPELTEGQPLPTPADCPDTFLICIDDGPFEGEDLVRSDWIVSSELEGAWIPLAYARQKTAPGDPGADGEDGKGWTSGNYNPSNGVVTFLSNDGLGFNTDDIRGDDGDDGDNGENGPGWTGGSYSDQTGVVTFTSDDGLGFATGDLRGANGTNGNHGINGKGWTSGSYDELTGIVTFTSDDGLEFATSDLRGEDGKNGTSASGTVNSVNGNFPDPDGAVSLNALDVGAISQETVPTVPAYVKAISQADITRWDSAGGSDFSGNYNDLTNKPTIPTYTSQLSNNSGYITTANLAGYSTTSHNHNGVYAPASHTHSYQAVGYSYSKAESDAKYQAKGGGGGTSDPLALQNGISLARGQAQGTEYLTRNVLEMMSTTGALPNHTGFLLECSMAGGWGGQAALFRMGNNWGKYNTSPALTVKEEGCYALDFLATSDIKLKEDIVTAKSDVIKQLQGREWNWKDGGNKGSGVIAQELEKVLPHLVTEQDGTKHVTYSGLTAYLIEAVKELSARVEELEGAK